MNDSSLQFDRTCHVLYSRACKKQIKSKIALHYPPEQREAVWTQVQLKYVGFISGWRTDLGGKSNFHNGREAITTVSRLWHITPSAKR